MRWLNARRSELQTHWIHDEELCELMSKFANSAESNEKLSAAAIGEVGDYVVNHPNSISGRLLLASLSRPFDSLEALRHLVVALLLDPSNVEARRLSRLILSDLKDGAQIPCG